MHRVARVVVLAAIAATAWSAPAAAQIDLPPLPIPVPPGLPPLPGDPTPDLPIGVPLPFNQGPGPRPFQADDGLGFRDVLPSGTRGHYSAAELAAFLAAGVKQPHCCDQLPMYRDLVYATPGLRAEDIPKYFKDSSFGVRAGDVERVYSPRRDVTIVRDKGFGVPHVYGRTRDGAMFGLGYVGAEDRLFFMDVLRHAGRGELSSFAGGSNQAMDEEQWSVAPYSEADLERQATQLPEFLGVDGALIQRDIANYVAGINRYIAEARIDPNKMPAEYAAIGRPQGADAWKPTDLIATAALVGGIFGKGGGEELAWSQVADKLQQRMGRRKGARAFRDFRSAEDPEAPTTVLRKRFRYQAPSKRVRRGTVGRPDPGSLRPQQIATSSSSPASAEPGEGLGLSRLSFPPSASNALLIAGRHSAGGHPLMVAGPQVGYFNPEILMEQDVHAPASGALPGIDARGASFIGINLYVQLGRGRDYAWSATSAGQDIIDTFAVPLCDATHYRFRGRCEAIEVLERTNTWLPNPGDPTPAGTQRLRAERTKLGLVAGRGTVKGKPVLFTKLRSTYFHEVDSAAGFLDFNDPGRIRDAASFQRAAGKIGYTFNWLYADADHIGYFNSGANPVRAKRIDHNFPVRAKRSTEWRGWDPDRWIARFSAFGRHPRVIDQKYLVSWNNKQAKAHRGSDENVFSSVYRSLLLEDRVKFALRGGRKLTLPQLIDIMEVAGTGDLRAHSVLPSALRMIGKPKDPALAGAVAELRAWRKAGGLRKDADGNGVYEHANAVRIMDAWWPKLVRAQFKPRMGRAAFDQLRATTQVDNAPNNHGDHLGSAYQGAWYGYSRKDLRTVLGRKVKGRYGRKYCGKGSRRRCRGALRKSLARAVAVPASRVYGKDEVCEKAGMPGDQWCFDAVRFTPVGGATQPLIHFINRPTYQQVTEIQRRLPR